MINHQIPAREYKISYRDFFLSIDTSISRLNILSRLINQKQWTEAAAEYLLYLKRKRKNLWPEELSRLQDTETPDNRISVIREAKNILHNTTILPISLWYLPLRRPARMKSHGGAIAHAYTYDFKRKQLKRQAYPRRGIRRQRKQHPLILDLAKA